MDQSTADRIIYAAMQIIGESGLKGLSASKLAEAANISKSTVFHHFKKMDDIPALILEKLYQEIINPVQDDHYSSVREYLLALGASGFSDNEQHITIYKAFLSLYQASLHDRQLLDIVNKCSEQFDNMLYGKLQQLCAGHIGDAQLQSFVRLICMSLDGISLHFLIHGSPERANETWTLFVDTFVNQFDLS